MKYDVVIVGAAQGHRLGGLDPETGFVAVYCAG